MELNISKLVQEKLNKISEEKIIEKYHHMLRWLNEEKGAENKLEN